jgi:hypothetical protein
MTTLSVGAIGAVIRVTIRENHVPLDISTATVKQIVLYGETTPKYFDASFYTNGRDGILQYITTSTGDLDQVVNYTIRCYLELPDYSGLTMETDGFSVK